MASKVFEKYYSKVAKEGILVDVIDELNAHRLLCFLDGLLHSGVPHDLVGIGGIVGGLQNDLLILGADGPRGEE
mgnify:CR=1 FL=1